MRGCREYADDTPASTAPSHATIRRFWHPARSFRTGRHRNPAGGCASSSSALSDTYLRRAVLVEPDGDIFLFHVDLEGVIAAVPADSARLDAAERRRQVPHILRIDPDHAGFDALGDAMGTADVAGPDIGGEAIADVVGNPQGVRLVLEGDRGQHRTKDLFLRDPHRGECAGEQGRG